MLTWRPRMLAWHRMVFGDRHMVNGAKVYSMRLMEEAMELAQAEGVTADQAMTILRQMFDKPAGEPAKEFGGVLVTATGYANFADRDIEATFEAEYERIQDSAVVERVRFRNLHGDKIGMREER